MTDGASASKQSWEPMKLTHLGDVVELVQQGEPPGKGLTPFDSAGGGGKQPPGKQQ
jgi:hypothetical protein